MKKRDRRPITPYRTPLTVGKSDKQSTLFDEDFICDAVPESTGSPEKVDDTSSDFYLKGEGTSKEKSKDKHNEIISKSNSSDMINMNINLNLNHPNPKNTVTVFGPDKKRLKNTTQLKAKKWIKENKARQVKDKFRPGEFAIQLLDKPVGKIRVPVVHPDGSPAMPTLSSRARRWIEEGKAVPKRTKTGIFYVQLIEEPSGRDKQDIVLLNDPGNRFTGVAVVSKKAVLYG